MRNEKAQTLRYESICNFVFMHATIEHGSECKYRHLMLKSDILTDDENQITSGTLRFHVLKIVSPTEYVVRPIMLSSAENQQDWHIINGSDEFKVFDLQMQAHYKNDDSRKLLESLELGQMCVALWEERFYRAQIIRIIEKK